MKLKHPYISIVIAARNDDYQGGSLLRFQLALDALTYQAKKYRLDAEVIVVEWNPPVGRPPLYEALTYPQDSGPLEIRFVTVPASVHGQYKDSEKLNMIRGADLNVGIRRAKGDFIFATNSDILFSNELIELLALRKLDPQFFYRARRFDVDRKVADAGSVEHVLDFCAKHIILSYGKDSVSHHGLRNHPNLYINGGDFILFSREYWWKMHGWPEINSMGLYSDSLVCYMAHAAGLKEKVLDDALCVYHIDHDSRWKKLATPRAKAILFLKNYFYVDSEQVALKAIIRRVRRASDSVILFFSNMFNGSKSDFTIRRWRADYEKTLIGMLKGTRLYAYNDTNWGMPEQQFKEFIVPFHTNNQSQT